MSAASVQAEEIQFTASVNKRVLSMQDRLVLVLTVSGATKNISMPPFQPIEGFNLLYGPSVGTQTQIINGVVSSKRIYEYGLSPVKEGIFEIPAYEVTVEGKTYQTEPVQIEVKKGAPPTEQVQPGDQPRALTQEELSQRLFVELTTDKKEAVVNEQVVLTFRFYRNLAVDGLSYEPSATKGFLEESLGEQRNTRQIINGIEYEVIELKKALFPVTAGTLEISPARLACNILIKAPSKQRRNRSLFDDFFDDPFSDSFFGGRYVRRPVKLVSDPVQIQVSPLPEAGKPQTFSGAVGKFDFAAEAKPKEVAAGDPITLTMTVTGMGNLQSIKSPVLAEDLTQFKIYEPESKTEILSRKEGIIGKKVFEVVLVPKEEDITEIPQIEFTFYDPEKKQYLTLRKGPIPIQVSPPQKSIQMISSPGSSVDKKAVELLEKDIFYIKDKLGKLAGPHRRFYRHPLFYAGTGLPVIIYLVLFLLYQRSEKLRLDPKYARSTFAAREAKLLLKQAKAAKTEKEVCSLVEKAILHYLADKLGLQAGSILVPDLKNLLEDQGMEETGIKEVQGIIENAELGRFAGGAGIQMETSELISDAESWIAGAEKSLKK